MGSASVAPLRAVLAERAAIEWHLQYNHYPPIPVQMTDVALEALSVVRPDPYEFEDVRIQLPDGVTWRGQETAPVSAIMENMHLWDFVDAE